MSKAVEDNAGAKLRSAGADRTVNTLAIGGLRLVSEMVRPTVVSFLDTMLRDPNQLYRFEELLVRPQSALDGKTLAEADLRSAGDVLVVAVRKPDAQAFTYNPKANFCLSAGCVLVVLGQLEHIAVLRPRFSGD